MRTDVYTVFIRVGGEHPNWENKATFRYRFLEITITRYRTNSIVSRTLCLPRSEGLTFPIIMVA